MTTVVLIALVILAGVAGWHVFEMIWDRRLFAGEAGRLVENIRPRDARALLHSNTGIQILDVRTPQEFATASLPGAVNIPLSDLAFRERLARLDVRVPVLVYCSGGYRSRKALPLLREVGFVSIHHLHRGICSWRLAGLPVIHAGSREMP